MKAIKRLWNYITSAKYFIGDFVWQLDHDVDALNAFIINAEKDATKQHADAQPYAFHTSMHRAILDADAQVQMYILANTSWSNHNAIQTDI